MLVHVVSTTTPTSRPAITAAPPQPAVDSYAGSASSLARTAVRVPLMAVGAVAGTLAGLAVGGPIGITLGGAVGFSDNPDQPSLAFFQPMQHIAGIGGSFVHQKAEKFVGKLFGDKVGRIAGKGLGAITGVVTGAAIGVLAGGWWCLDVGMRLGQRAADKIVGPAGPQEPKAGHKSYEEGWGPQIPTPDGKIDPTSHHYFFIKYGLQILASDAAKDPSLQKVNAFMNSDPDYARYFQMGAWNMDTFLGEQMPGVSLSTFHHFREPFMPGFKSAGWQARQCYDAAADSWKAGNRQMAIYYLGAAAHPLQDLNFPQHAVKGVGFVGKMLGHQMMEEWMENHGNNYVATDGKYFPNASRIEDIAETVGADAATRYTAAVKEATRYVKDPANFQPDIFKQYWLGGEQITPGILEFFFRDMANQGYPI